MKVDSSVKVPPTLSSRLKVGISHLLMSSVSHLQDEILEISVSRTRGKEVTNGLSFSCFVDIMTMQDAKVCGADVW